MNLQIPQSHLLSALISFIAIIRLRRSAILGLIMLLFSETIDTAINFSEDQDDTKKCPSPQEPTSQQVIKQQVLNQKSGHAPHILKV